MNHHSNSRPHWGRWLCAVLALLVCALPLAAVLFLTPLEITGRDMFPTLMDGDIVLTLPGNSCSPGDVIAFTCQGKLQIKRVAALAGDTVLVSEDGTVLVNGAVWETESVSSLSLGPCDIEQPCTVPAGCVYVLGDERITAADSRNSSVGCVPQENILGRVVFCIWPFSAIGPVR